MKRNPTNSQPMPLVFLIRPAAFITAFLRWLVPSLVFAVTVTTRSAEPVNFEVSSSSVAAANFLDRWHYRHIIDGRLGVWARDPVGHYIGNAPAERFGVVNNWYPLDVYKQSIVGTLHNFKIYD